MRSIGVSVCSLLLCASCAHAPEVPEVIPWECNPTEVPEGLSCPSEYVREQEQIIVDSFERFFFELTPEERDCVSRYYYLIVYTLEDISEACWDGVWACALYHPDSVSRIKVYYNGRNGNYNLTIHRHEVLHLILWCSGEPGSGDHSHPAYTGQLPAYPDGSKL